MVDQPTVKRQVCLLDYQLQIIIGLVELVPEKQVRLGTRSAKQMKNAIARAYLRELEIIEVEPLHDLIPNSIGGSE